MNKKHFISWLENQKITHKFSDRKKPDIILTLNNNMALGLKYDCRTMVSPVVVIKGQNFYAEKIIDAGKNNNITIRNEPGLVIDLYDNAKEGRPIPERYYEAIARIYSQLVKHEKKLPDKTTNSLNEMFFEQRKKEYEIFSVNIPEKIELQLSSNLFTLVKDQFFKISLLGVQITNIKLSVNKNYESEEYCIKINGTNVKHGKISYISISPFQQLCLFLTDTLTRYSTEILGRDDVLQIISQMKEKYPALIHETMKYFSTGEIRQILCGLLEEKVSIHNITAIFETIADFGDKERNIDTIIDNVRKSIGREICSQYLCEDQTLKVIGLSNDFEKMIERNFFINDHCELINPVILGFINDAVEDTVNKPVILCSNKYRRLIYKEFKKYNSQAVIISPCEIPQDVNIEYLLIIDVPENSEL